jgi:hypothetical protein
LTQTRCQSEVLQHDQRQAFPELHGYRTEASADISARLADISAGQAVQASRPVISRSQAFGSIPVTCGLGPPAGHYSYDLGPLYANIVSAMEHKEFEVIQKATAHLSRGAPWNISQGLGGHGKAVVYKGRHEVACLQASGH